MVAIVLVSRSTYGIVQPWHVNWLAGWLAGAPFGEEAQQQHEVLLYQLVVTRRPEHPVRPTVEQHALEPGE
eukprot:SAG22_NODE_4078_length_1394_cov_0.823938_2_plen_71_part_00